MLKALIRTAGIFGTIFAAGYIAQRYFGVDTKGLLNQAKDKAKNKWDDMQSDASDVLETKRKNQGERQAI